VSAEREVVDRRLLATEVVDADLGIRDTTAVAGLKVRLVLLVAITFRRTATAHATGEQSTRLSSSRQRRRTSQRPATPLGLTQPSRPPPTLHPDPFEATSGWHPLHGPAHRAQDSQKLQYGIMVDLQFVFGVRREWQQSPATHFGGLETGDRAPLSLFIEQSRAKTFIVDFCRDGDARGFRYDFNDGEPLFSAWY